MIKTLDWTDEGVVMIDQRHLPTEELYPVFRTYTEVAQAIKDMVVRGAPAIGVAAARRKASLGEILMAGERLSEFFLCNLDAPTEGIRKFYFSTPDHPDR